MIANRMTARRRIGPLLIGLLLAGCATPDFYDRRAQAIEEHHKEFHRNLEKNRLEDALFENEHIEAIASELAAAIKKRGRPSSTKQVDQEWMLLTKATSAAVENRLALGKHLARKKKYEQAIIVYDGLIDNYGDTGGTCRSRAMYEPDKFNNNGEGGTSSQVAADRYQVDPTSAATRSSCRTVPGRGSDVGQESSVVSQPASQPEQTEIWSNSHRDSQHIDWITGGN